MARTERDRFDPKRLIAESYAIEGIGMAECRSIFLDWALSLPDAVAPDAAIAALLARHGEAEPDHPMTAVLREGQAAPPPRRRGGRARRVQ